jgi:hypothetical protein
MADAILDLKSYQGKTIRAMSTALGISQATINRMYCQDNFIMRVTNSIKPFLTERNKMVRLLRIQPNCWSMRQRQFIL